MVMVEDQSEPPRTSSRTRNVRLGALEASVEDAARSAGITVSAWMRQAIEAALPGSNPVPTPEVLPPADTTPRRRFVLRTTASNAVRWQQEAKAHALSLAKYIELQMSVTPDQAHRVAAAGETVRAALIEIAAIGRNLNQMARSWNTYPGQSTAAERKALAETGEKLDRVCARVSALVGELEVRQGRRRVKVET